MVVEEAIQGELTDRINAYSEPARATHEEENNGIWINKLPTEILAHIFTAGRDMDMKDDSGANDKCIPKCRWRQWRRDRCAEFQETMAKVCRRWRTVAINTPTLWRSIVLAQAYPRFRTAIFLERSGLATSLDIEIMIEELSFDIDTDPEEFHIDVQARAASEALEFIVSRGGIPSRWARLAFWYQTTSAMLTIIDFIVNADLNNIRELSLVNDYPDPVWEEAYQAMHKLKADLTRSELFRIPPPMLRQLDLVAMPTQFLFARRGVPPASNLVHLQLGSLLQLPPINALHGLLSSNPRLETLHLEMGMIEDSEFEAEEPENLHVTLPYLYQFSLQEPVALDWGLHVLGMIDAPKLKEFRLGLHRMEPTSGFIPLYVAKGRLGGRMLPPTQLFNDIPSNGKLGCIYPALRYLAVGQWFPDGYPLRHLLLSCKYITKLDWEVEKALKLGLSVEILTEFPASGVICPYLRHFRVHSISEKDLLRLIRGRDNIGCPLRLVEVGYRSWHRISEQSKEFFRERMVRVRPYPDGTELDEYSGSGGSDTESSRGDNENELCRSSDDSDSTNDEDEDEAPRGSSDEGVFTGDDSS